MPQKPLLQELLQEDQEPFLLKNYIADRRCQIKKPISSRTHLQLKKRKPISQNFCKNACFFSVNNSPNLTKSPLFDFQSPTKSPCKTSNAIFLHIPAKTASLLLEAALRIQKQSATPKSKNVNNGFSLFGSLIKKLTHRSKTRKREIKENIVNATLGYRKVPESISEQEKSFSCSCNGRPSSTVWSESNEEKSWDLDLETSSSSQSEEVENFKYLNVDGICDFASFDNHFCESPFHFVLRRSPSSGHRTPVFSSPVISPSRHKSEGKENNNEVMEILKKFEDKEEEEEDKEQSSPVSVLDPPFQDDDDGHDDHSEDDRFDLECSYAIVQRAKQQLLQKLRRFEKLAELDPIELEKRMLEQEQESDDDDNKTEEKEEEFLECEENELQQSIDRFVIQELSKSRKIPREMKTLVSDLIKEEEKEGNCFIDRETMVKRVCKKFELWKEVESNTIDMMVEEDFKKEFNGWKMHQEQVKETALEIEFGIFGLLVEELFEELVAAA
ncbi:hypothetical protein JCGZ_23635 [Jatropha curcas]|uniref:Uncharacterized protein n=2 Tax=Jatropha curcas TaxID=180498 RepID=A0A067LDY1_JATCU|nr:hypothetical protein JCGZ_23635 [Jatropha curcas]